MAPRKDGAMSDVDDTHKPIQERNGFPDTNFVSAKECLELVDLRNQLAKNEALVKMMASALEYIESDVGDMWSNKVTAIETLKAYRKASER
jgi:hypothetical protein